MRDLVYLWLTMVILFGLLHHLTMCLSFTYDIGMPKASRTSSAVRGF
jgi:hypothetical protein